VLPGIRSARERAFQTLCFEGLGLALVTPLFSAFASVGWHESSGLLALLSLAVAGWSAAFNTIFDIAELRLGERRASERPQAWRLVHALAHEASAAVVCCPLIHLVTGLDWAEALTVDLGLTLTYAFYGYGFHLAYDRWRPCPTLRPGG
jgi:uncharacterized membrane protein